MPLGAHSPTLVGERVAAISQPFRDLGIYMACRWRPCCFILFRRGHLSARKRRSSFRLPGAKPGQNRIVGGRQVGKFRKFNLVNLLVWCRARVRQDCYWVNSDRIKDRLGSSPDEIQRKIRIVRIPTVFEAFEVFD